jgi:hypothetical protein
MLYCIKSLTSFYLQLTKALEYPTMEPLNQHQEQKKKLKQLETRANLCSEILNFLENQTSKVKRQKLQCFSYSDFFF